MQYANHILEAPVLGQCNENLPSPACLRPGHL
jgi:hypothetical protein